MSDSDKTTRILGDDSSPDDPGIRFEEWEDYKIESLLGEGGMARVYKAFDPKLNRYVALKFIRTPNDSFKKRLLREARAQAQIEHDSVCKIYEVGEVQGQPYIAMQLIHGESLQKLASKMSLQQKVLLFERVCDALHAAHKLGIVHRDIKPANIMVETRDDGSFRPYVMDFGIAREIADAGLTATDVVIGTPAYMAPEQVAGNQGSVDRRTDVFSLGATLYCILSGKQPFSGTGMEVMMKVVSEEPVPLKQVSPSIPDDLEIIVAKCMEKESTARYDSARALGDDLKRYVDGEPILARRASITQRLTKKIRKNKTVAAIVAIASIIIFISAAFGAFTYVRTSRQVRVAREMSRSVEAMDWIMRVAMMSPLHDIRKERSFVLKKMEEIQTLMKDAGKAGIGPGNYALGRGFMALQDYDQARSCLEKAWAAGYRDKDVANALGLVLGEQYKEKRSEANRISDPAARQLKLQEFEHDYRSPAIQYLKLGSGSRSQSPEYGQSLLAYYEKDYTRSLKLANAALNQSASLHEASLLKGDIYSRIGEEEFQKGKYEDAKKHLEAAAREYVVAENIARSDPKVYQSLCWLWKTVMEIQFATGENPKKSYAASTDACKNAIMADAESATTYNYLAQTSWRWGEHLFEIGDDPTAAFVQATDLSRKAQILEPDNATGFFIMGTAYGYLADYELRIGKDPSKTLDQSIKALLLAIEKDPRHESAYTNLGVSYFSQGAQAMSSGQDSKPYFLKAVDAYRKAVEITPIWNAYANIGNAFALLGQDAESKGEDPIHYFQESINSYKSAMKVNPNHWLILTNLASTYVAQIEYEVEHGKDIADSFKNITTLCEQSLKLNPQNPYPTVNLAQGYLHFADYKSAQGADPHEFISKADSLLMPITDAQMPEIFLALAFSKKLAAAYSLRQKQDPTTALSAAKKYLATAGSINPQEALVPLNTAQIYLIEAEWQKSLKHSPESALKSAAVEIENALKLNPRSAAAYSVLGEIELMRIEWKVSLKQSTAEEIKAGLDAIEQSIKIKSDAGKAYSIRGRLLLYQALQSASKSTLAAEAIKNFEQGLRLNPLLQSRDAEVITKAKSLLSELS